MKQFDNLMLFVVGKFIFLFRMCVLVRLSLFFIFHPPPICLAQLHIAPYKPKIKHRNWLTTRTKKSMQILPGHLWAKNFNGKSKVRLRKITTFLFVDFSQQFHCVDIANIYSQSPPNIYNYIRLSIN